MELFGVTVALQNNIVSMMPNFLGGKNAANGMQENVFQKGIPHPLMPQSPPMPPMAYPLMSHLSNQVL